VRRIAVGGRGMLMIVGMSVSRFVRVIVAYMIV
jgi:hypothetical protein